MIKSQRKQHLVIWAVMAFVLPAGIIIAWMAIPQQATQALLQPEIISPLPVIIKKAETKNYSVAIRSNANGTQLQLEWINKTVLQYPTATIYAGTSVNKEGQSKLIGRIGARGKWYFSLDSSFHRYGGNTDHFILFDFIGQQIIDTINLEP